MSDRAVIYKHQQEIRINNLFIEQLIHLTENDESVNALKNTLSKNISISNKQAKLFAILDNENIEKFIVKKQTFEKNIYINILSEIKNGKSEGRIEVQDIIYYWFLKKISANNKNKLLTVNVLSPSTKSEFIDFFGLPFFISGFLLCWSMVWASIILSSLISKLELQKQVVSEQAEVIEKARDEALYANSAKSNFLANMSHEIRTPLTSVVGFAESCLDIDQSIKQRSTAIKTIIKSSKHLMHIINEILDLSKIEAGKLEVEMLPCSAIDIIDEINPIVSGLAKEKGLSLSVNYNYPLPKNVNTDPLRLKQILLNLFSNAIKFTSDGFVNLNVSYESKTSQLIFEVVDSGIGLLAEHVDKIFLPFEQSDSSITRKYGGTGLGLALSKQLTEMLNGTLVVESQIDEGSRFIVSLKVTEEEKGNLIYEHQVKKRLEKSNIEDTEIPRLSGKILVAEDNEDIQALVKLLFNKMGIIPDIVENGKLVIERALESEYDLVFMDVQMPVMDGITAMNELKRQGYSKPVIAMTANAMQKDREECFAAGFTDFISKPISRDIFYETLEQYLTLVSKESGDKTLLTSDLLHKEPDLIDLIDKFILRLPIMRDAIVKAHIDQQGEELSGLIHQMKGVGGGYGYPMLTKLCEKMEFQIESQNNDNVSALIDDLKDMVEEILAGHDENHKIAEQAQP